MMYVLCGWHDLTRLTTCNKPALERFGWRCEGHGTEREARAPELAPIVLDVARAKVADLEALIATLTAQRDAALARAEAGEREGERRERAAVVAWLRGRHRLVRSMKAFTAADEDLADAIEAGEPLKEQG